MRQNKAIGSAEAGDNYIRVPLSTGKKRLLGLLEEARRTRCTVVLMQGKTEVFHIVHKGRSRGLPDLTAFHREAMKPTP